MSTRCSFAVWRPITANITEGGRQQIRGFVPHVQVGIGSLWGFFNTPKPKGKGASADFWCSKTGVLEQYVDLADQSWAQGSKQHNGNPFFVSCEFEGDPNEPMTPQQIAMGGRLIAWVRAEVNDFALQVNHDPNGEGITPHYVFGGGHTCPNPGPPPGPRELQFPDLVAAAQQQQPQPSPQPPSEEDEDMAKLVRFPGHNTGNAKNDEKLDKTVYIITPLGFRRVTSEADLATQKYFGIVTGDVDVQPNADREDAALAGIDFDALRK